MTLFEYIIGGIFVIFVAIMSFRHHPDRGKGYEQRRDELYEYSQQRMEEFKATEMVPRELDKREGDSPEGPLEESPEEDREENPEEGSENALEAGEELEEE